MSEPVKKCLSLFTPDSSALDRDSLMFAAGKASVRPSRGWKLLAGSLAACQLFTLFLLLTAMSSPGQNSLVEPRNVISSDKATAPEPPNERQLGSLNRLLAKADDGDWPAPSAAEDGLMAHDPPQQVNTRSLNQFLP